MTERELVRNAARRLVIIRHAQEVSGNVARTCRYFGISRHTYYTWLRRYEEQGVSVTDRGGPSRVRTQRRARSSARSCTCARPITSARRDLDVPQALPRPT